MLEHREDLPDAAFCCNDDLAVGMLETLQEHGVRVPEDIVISGFDNREISMRTNPRITTVDRDYFTIAQTAMRTLEQSLDGMNPPKRAYSPVRYVLGGSCGYQTNYEEKAMSDVYTLDNSLKHFYEILSLFQSTVMSADSLEVILRVSEKYAKELECNNVYLSVSDRYLRSDYDHGVDSYGPVMHLMAYTGKDYRGKCDEKHIYSSYLTRHLLPPEIALSKPLYVVLPLRHNEACIGVAVTEGVSSAMRHGFLAFFLTLLAGSMESVQKKEQLRIANARLDNLYVHDQLTGLFNRFGLDRFGTIAYEHLLRDFGAAHFIFVDIDDMKGINDNGGHEMGDLAIRDTAEIIRRATRDENAFSMRYGGDEFLLICRRNLIPKLERELEAERNNMQYPYLLSLSMGACLVQKEEQLSLMEAIEQADRQMYRNKRAHKEDR